MGWVPVEMTPEYCGVMEEPDLTLGLEAEGARTAPLPETETEQKENTPEINTHWNLQIAVTGLVKFILLLLLVFDIFGICFLITVYILRAVANIRRRGLFSHRTEDRQYGQWQGMQEGSMNRGLLMKNFPANFKIPGVPGRKQHSVLTKYPRKNVRKWKSV